MNDERRSTISRRRFLKFTAAGALAFSSLPTIIAPRRVQAYRPGGRINPNIDPLRVVGVRDPQMTTEEAPSAPWSREEELVAWDRVQENLDRMACALAEEKNPADAWRAIFIKPAGKSWSEVVVAIKTNQIAQQRTRSAVMSKVCHVLTDLLGVQGQNVHIYDACHGGGMAENNPFKGLPEGVAMENQWGGYNTAVPVPTPYKDGASNTRCLDHLVAGKVDILVNIALCKGHGSRFGGFTMSMKNHFGTLNPRPSHRAGGGADYLIGINKTPQILGGMDQKTGDVLFPRQQLCIIDALWASEPGPGGQPTAQPNALLMGAFAPALDYVGALRLRRDTMGWGVNEQVAERFLTEFGLRPEDLPGGGQIVNALEST